MIYLSFTNWGYYFAFYHKVFFIVVKKRINKNIRYNGGFDDFKIKLIIAFA